MPEMTTKTILRTLVIVGLSSTVALAAQQRGILGKPAPSLGVSYWINLPKGKKTLDVLGHRGKIVYLYCFQSWCPACNSHGFPLLKDVAKHYEGKDDVVFLAVQTVFEGFLTNTAARAKAVAVGKFKLDIPIGHDAGPDGKRSVVLKRTGPAVPLGSR
jgi:thiol-disulfide isomerase/thioredoxin